MRVVFLDIDGVLNSKAFLRKLDDRHRQLGHEEPPRPKRETTCECYRLENQIDPDAVARLNRLVAETAAKIVVSSSWRKLLDPPELSRVLTSHGLVAEIVGETPDAWDETVRSDMKMEYGQDGDRLFRGHEIDFWLRYTGKDVDRFVILDDGSDMAMHKNRHVQTDPSEGLLDEHVELAIRMMSWDGKTVPPPTMNEDETEAEEEAEIATKPVQKLDEQPVEDLRSALADWTDFDAAEFALARCLGIIDPATEWSPSYKHLFWTNNPVGNGLGEILLRLIELGAIETNADSGQFRWNSAFDLGRASAGEPRCTCGEDDGTGPSLPHKSGCPAGDA